MTALLLGTALAVASLCYVLWPLYRAEVAAAPRAPGSPKMRETRAVEALRELEFDRQTGKIADTDYGALKVGRCARDAGRGRRLMRSTAPSAGVDCSAK